MMTMIILIIAAMVTYLIQYDSVISPGYIEFDDRRKKEVKLMIGYNNIFDKAFKIYIVLLVIAIILYLYMGSIVFLMAGLYIQLIYFGITIFVMGSMYVRSIHYWNTEGRKEMTTP